MPPSPRGSAGIARSFSLRPAPKEAGAPSGNIGQRGTASVVILASAATCRRQVTEASAPLIFRIPVSPPHSLSTRLPPHTGRRRASSQATYVPAARRPCIRDRGPHSLRHLDLTLPRFRRNARADHRRSRRAPPGPRRTGHPEAAVEPGWSGHHHHQRAAHRGPSHAHPPGRLDLRRATTDSRSSAASSAS